MSESKIPDGWTDGLPDESGHNAWKSVRIDCPLCGVAVIQNPFVVWCDECQIHREVEPDTAV